ncbi:MAG: PAS domain S-box protein, partial [bacterium]
MLWQWSPSVIAELAASVILLALAIYLPWRDFNRQARLTGVTLIFVCALWILSHAIEIGLPVVAYKETLVGIQLVLGIIAMTFWLLYILHYLGPRRLLTWRVYLLFGIMPLIAILALLTNHVYALAWTGIGLDSQNPYLPLQPAYGVIYWICMVYTAILTFTGSLIIFQNVIRRRHSYSRESTYLLAAAVIPLLTAFIEVTGLLSSLKLPVGLTPWAACIGAIILRLSLPRFRLERVLPIARDIIFERIGDCLLVLDMQNRVLDLNPPAERLLGCRVSDVLGLSIERIWPDQSPPMMSFNNMAKAGEELVLERNGEQRTYDLRISTMTDSGGCPTNQVVLLTDITDRKLAEEALRRSEARYRLLVQTQQDLVVETDMEGHLLFVNAAYCALFGKTEEELIGSNYIPLIHPDDLPLVAKSIASLFAPPYECSFEERANTKYGWRWLSWTDKAILDDQGVAATLVATGRDITELKEVEEALQES